jgi:hypothetical protein
MWCEQNRGAGVRPGSVVAQCCPAGCGWCVQTVAKMDRSHGFLPRNRGETLCISHPSSAHTRVAQEDTDVAFHLHGQKFLELLAAGQSEPAVAFAREHLAAYRTTTDPARFHALHVRPTRP